jgi:putative ABC transport system substrate-binding protein
MLRRALFALTIVLSLCALSLSFAASAEQTNKMYRVGFLEAGSAAANQPFLASLESGLRELGYVEGKNVVLNVRWAEGQAERLPGLLAELVELHPDAIVVASGAAAQAAKKIGTSIPIVFVGASDPLGRGLVTSLAHPGSNLTGLSDNSGPGVQAKAIQLLKDIVPRASRAAILWNPVGTVNPRQRIGDAKAAVRTLGMTPVPVEARSLSGIDEAFFEMRQQHVDVLMVLTGPLTLQHRDAIVNLAAANRIPAGYEYTEFARAGGLIAYSASIPALFSRAATYLDRIFKGANPGDLPVEQPTKFELVVNLKTARALGVTIPQSVLLRADEVIQ